MTDKLRSTDANNVLSNPAYKKAMEKIERNLEEKVKSCPPNDPKMAQSVVLAKQIFYGIQRELVRIMNDVEREPNLKEVSKTSVFKR